MAGSTPPNMQEWAKVKRMKHSEFTDRFQTTEQCLEFLASVKWADGYVCRKCGHTHYCKGKTPFARRCTRCKSEESATAHTMFHRCKIHLPEAFNILYTACNQPQVSAHRLSEQLEIRLMTCWKFRKKVKECMAAQV
jgi:predicted Zn-ribbon and HTH transcriptional regulator